MRSASLLLIFPLLLCFFSTQAKDSTVVFLSDTFELNGTLSIPDDTGKFPIVIMVHGSGPGDRNQTTTIAGASLSCIYPGLVGETVRNFRDFADRLKELGIASLRYDKLSLTHGTQLDPQSLSIYDFIGSIDGAVQFIQDIDHPQLIDSCIYLIGHSQGSNLIPYTAINNKAVKGLISMGGTVSGIDTLIAYQARQTQYECNLDTPAGNMAYNNNLSVFGQLRAGSWNPNTPIGGAYPKFWESWINVSDSVLINYERSMVPTLILQGADDWQVPVSEGIRFDADLNSTHKYIQFDSLNHFFTGPTNPIVPNYVVDSIGEWIKTFDCGAPKISSNIAAFQPMHIDLFQVQGRLLLTSNDVMVGELMVFSLDGKMLLTKSVNRERKLVLDLAPLASGTYLAVFNNGQQRVNRLFQLRP